jgi:hypothetical protein
MTISPSTVTSIAAAVVAAVFVFGLRWYIPGVLVLAIGAVAGVVAVVTASRARRGRAAAWAALALNVSPVVLYAVAVAIWLSRGGD